MKLFHNFVTYFNVICVICGEIIYTSNIYDTDAEKSISNFLVKIIFGEY